MLDIKKDCDSSKIGILPFHPFADIFPLMKGDEFEELVGDIKRRGLNEPIVLYQDKILDGRNRARACEKAGVKPRYHPFVGTDEDASRYVISANILRRHLTPDDRRKFLKKLLGMNPDMSDRAIGKVAGFDHKTVAKERGKAEVNGEIPHKDRVEKTGRKARGRKPTTRLPAPPPAPATMPPEGRATLEIIAQPLADDRGDNGAAANHASDNSLIGGTIVTSTTVLGGDASITASNGESLSTAAALIAAARAFIAQPQPSAAEAHELGTVWQQVWHVLSEIPSHERYH